ncbi:MAG: hypothetical protein HN380_18765 [Victivallales bacterium]|jgi:hypothetical protein|nr:hypothetical protein [Victivallales bacterium]
MATINRHVNLTDLAAGIKGRLEAYATSLVDVKILQTTRRDDVVRQIGNFNKLPAAIVLIGSWDGPTGLADPAQPVREISVSVVVVSKQELREEAKPTNFLPIVDEVERAFIPLAERDEDERYPVVVVGDQTGDDRGVMITAGDWTPIDTGKQANRAAGFLSLTAYDDIRARSDEPPAPLGPLPARTQIQYSTSETGDYVDDYIAGTHTWYRLSTDYGDTWQTPVFFAFGGDGSTWLYGEGAPASGLGFDGNYYLDNTGDGNVTYRRTDGSWSAILTQPPATQEEAEAGTETGIRSWSVLRIWQAIRAWFAVLAGWTKEPTGFDDPDSVVVTGENSTRTVTLTGTWSAIWRGVLDTTIVTGWTSDAHGTDTAKAYFLRYDGAAGTAAWVDISTIDDTNYQYILISIAYYDTENTTWVYTRECHGLMTWQNHRADHANIGTYKTSGGTLADYTLDSTTAADRRPSVAATRLMDEDVPTTNDALAAEGNYPNFTLSGAGAAVSFDTAAVDVVPLNGNIPYWNEYTGGAWQQTAMTNNTHMSVWVLEQPMAADAPSQALRHLFIQGQAVSAAEATEAAREPASISLGALQALSPEWLFVSQIIIKYIGNNWQIVQVRAITGNRHTQTSSPQGTALTSVATTTAMSGDGTTGDPLDIIRPDTAKTTPVDADELTLFNSASTYARVRLTLANLWVYIKALIVSTYTVIIGVAELPGSPTTSAIYRLTATDTTAKAAKGFYYHDGTAWFCLLQLAVYDLGNLTGAQTVPSIFNAVYIATTTGNTTWTFPAVAGAGAISIRLTNGGAYTQTWDAQNLWPGGTAPSLTASGVDLLTFVSFDGTNWDGTMAMEDVS